MKKKTYRERKEIQPYIFKKEKKTALKAKTVQSKTYAKNKAKYIVAFVFS